MAALTSTSLRVNGAVSPTVNTLTASDTFTFDQSKDQILELRNGTGGSLTPTLTGADAAAFAVPGYGSVTPGAFSFGAMAAGAVRSVSLNAIKKYMSANATGVVTVAAGTGISAILYEQ